jgi:hypothetical protein
MSGSSLYARTAGESPSARTAMSGHDARIAVHPMPLTECAPPQPQILSIKTILNSKNSAKIPSPSVGVTQPSELGVIKELSDMILLLAQSGATNNVSSRHL